MNSLAVAVNDQTPNSNSALLPAFWIDSIQLRYAGQEDDRLPQLAEIMRFELKSVIDPNHAEIQTIEDIAGRGPLLLTAGSLRMIQDSIVDEMNRRGFAGIVVMPAAGQIDPRTLADLRGATKETPKPMALIIWAARISQVGIIINDGKGPVTNPKLESRIMRHSPVHSSDPNRPGGWDYDFLSIKKINDFISQFNRSNSQRASVKIKPAQEKGWLDLDYVIQQEKPWRLYAQNANSGTKHSGQWRQRFGLIHNQLTQNDDVLNLDYQTSCFEDIHSFYGRYDLPFMDSMLSRLRLTGSLSRYESSELGAQNNFSGQETSLSVEMTRTLYQRDKLFIDGIAGFRQARHEVNNNLVEVNGLEQQMAALIGLEIENDTVLQRFVAGTDLSISLPDLAGTGGEGLTRLGRMNPDKDWMTLHYYASQSFYLEPLIDPNGWKDMSNPRNATLAHEIMLNLRGQLTGDRLIPQERMSAGGLYSVRGYPQSLVSGDSAIMATGEYRYHWPRSWSPRQPGRLPFSREPFRWAPQQVYGAPDWDLIFKLFCDAAHTSNSDPLSMEQDSTLMSVGLGLELQLKSNINIKCDFGTPLRRVRTPMDEAGPGDVGVHFVGTISF